jgi:zinc protease
MQSTHDLPDAVLLRHFRQGVTHDARLPFGATFVDRFTLPNGLRILTLEDHSAPIAAMYTGIGVGSRQEHDGKTGLAHLLEHLMFGGEHGSTQFESTVDAVGGRCNAFTWYDLTCYQTEVPSHAIIDTIRIEAHRMRELRTSPEDLTRELEIVLSERRMRIDDEPVGKLVEDSMALLFQDHTYGRPIIGTTADIKTLSVNDVTAFFAEHYGPNNMVLTFVGDIDTKQIIEHVQAGFGVIERRQLPAENVRPEFPANRERVQSVDIDLSARAWVGYLVPGLGDKLDHLAMVVLDQIMFGGRIGRVYRHMVSSDCPISTNVSSQHVGLAHYGAYWISMMPREDVSLDKLVAALDECIWKIKEEPVSQDEIDMARAQFEVDGFGALERVGYRAQAIGSSELVLGSPTAMLDDLYAIRYVGPGDILRVARRYLRSSERVVMKIGKGVK